jgi:hypothetical protein
MRPAVAVHRNDLGLQKSVRGLHGIVHVHGEMKGAAPLGGAREQQHDAGAEAARQLGDAIEPERVAGDINRWPLVEAEHETDDVARQGLYAGRAVPRGRRRYPQRAAIRLGDRTRLPCRKTDGVAAKPLRSGDSREDLARLAQKILPELSRLSAC